MNQIRSYLVLAALCLLLIGATFNAYGAVAAKKTPEAAAYEKDVDKLTDLIVTLMPLGKVFESIAAENPAWPVQDQPDRVTKLQLHCLRSELSTEGYRKLKRKDVEAYAAAHRETLKSDIQALESGAAELFGKLVMAGADAERTGVEVKAEDVLKSASAAQIESFSFFFGEPKLLDLRKVGGIGNALSTDKSKEENKSAGEALGEDMASKFMATAMKTCEVN